MPDDGNPLEYYTTPPEATRGLVRRIDHLFTPGEKIWEPACGSGSIARYLPPYCRIVASDIEYRGYGIGGIDFPKTHKKCETIITNPPFKRSLEFQLHALKCASHLVALLLPLSHLEGLRRVKQYRKNLPSYCLPFDRRISCSYGGMPFKGGTKQFMWLVWDSGHTGPPTLGWIVNRPTHHPGYDHQFDTPGNFHLLENP